MNKNITSLEITNIQSNSDFLKSVTKFIETHYNKYLYIPATPAGLVWSFYIHLPMA